MTHKCCSPECAQAFALLERQRADRKVLMAFRETHKKKGAHVAAAQKSFNAYIRARDAGKNCISSGKPLPLDVVGGGFDAGHYRSVGSAPHLRFHEDNVHGQSKHDNRHLSGNAVDFRLGLIARIGLARVDALEADQTPRHYSIDDLKAIKVLYDAKTKALRAIAQDQSLMEAA